MSRRRTQDLLARVAPPPFERERAEAGSLLAALNTEVHMAEAAVRAMAAYDSGLHRLREEARQLQSASAAPGATRCAAPAVALARLAEEDAWMSFRR